MATLDMQCSLSLDPTAFYEALEKAEKRLAEFTRKCEAAGVTVAPLMSMEGKANPPSDLAALEVGEPMSLNSAMEAFGLPPGDSPVKFREFF